MRKFSLSIALCLLVFAVVEARAQKDVRLNQTPKTFQTFYAKFRAAVLKGDRKTAVALTRFPFRYAFDAGDEGTFSKTEFSKKFNIILGDETNVFNQKSPKFYMEDESYYLNDEQNAASYEFEKTGAVWKFVGYYVQP